MVRAGSRRTDDYSQRYRRVKGAVAIVSTTSVSRASAYQIFLAALRTQGLAVVDSETSARVMPVVDAVFNAPPTVDPARPGTAPGQRVSPRC